ncbi:hypothetical protein MUP79_10650 [Candidatus Bathyarchaeota archaeon]|nr:hypothetical protein [Candidatus Bathyarchaeota archaeon]
MRKSSDSNVKFIQKELSHYDEQLKEDSERIEDEIFNRKERLSNLENGRFMAEKNTIFSAILQELKKKAKKKKQHT